MAVQIQPTLGQGEGDDLSFNFEQWINCNGLKSIKDAFIDHDMCRDDTTINQNTYLNQKPSF